MSTRSQQIKVFTEESKGISLPEYPRKMTLEEVRFLVKMQCEEIMELLYTVVDGPVENTKSVLLEIAAEAKLPLMAKPVTDEEIMAEQVDALVDIDYYNGNAACKAGFNMDDVFDIAHQANMRKRFSDGTFHAVDGKIIKPPNWTAPDVVSVVNRWQTAGTWK